MALKTKKQDTQEEHNYTITVKSAKQFDNGISVSLIIAAGGIEITIYGCWYRTYQDKETGEEKAFIAFPARKGSDGKYYNHVYVKSITDSDMESIEKQIEELI